MSIYRKPCCHRRVLSILAKFCLLILYKLNYELCKRLFCWWISLHILKRGKIRKNIDFIIHNINNGDIFVYSLFYDAFATIIEQTRIPVVIQLIERTLYWDFHLFSVPNSSYFLFYSIFLLNFCSWLGFNIFA